MHSLLIRQTEGVDGVRDEGLLDSALNAPFQSFAGQDPYPTVHEKAVRLAYGLIHNHPFIDGNKRIGTHAMLVFLDVNQIRLGYDDDDLIAAILATAAGDLDASSLLAWVRARVIPSSDRKE